MTIHLSKKNSGIRRPPIILDHNTKPKHKLPDKYIIVPLVVLNNDDVFVPRSGDGHVRPTNNLVHSAKFKAEAWVSHVAEVMQKGELMKGDVITWAGFNAQIRSDESIKPQAEIGILPLFPDKAASPSMMTHTMEIVKEITEFINAVRPQSLAPINHSTPYANSCSGSFLRAWERIRLLCSWERCITRISAS